MKRVTASDARRNWFRLLDEVVAGETVVIERQGVRVLLQREPARRRKSVDYATLLHAPDVDRADAWTWRRDADGQLQLEGADA